MRIIKGFLAVMAVVIAIGLAAAIFIQRNYVVERKIIINQPEEVVFGYIKFLKNQNNFSKWALMDSGMKQNYKGVDGSAGFVSSWESQNKHVGKGNQTIVQVIDYDRIDYDLHFIEPFNSKARAYMTTQMMTDHSTLVTWGFTGYMKYPTNLMLLLINMDKTIGNDLEEGLSNLKKILEN